MPQGAFFGLREGLGQAEGDGIGVVVGRFVQRHAAALGQCRFFQRDVEGQYRLVAPHGEPVGMGVEQCRFRLLGWHSSAIGQGKPYPYLHTPPAGPAKGGEGLRQKFRLLLHEFHFGAAGEFVHFYLHQSVVLFHPPFAVPVAGIFHGGIEARQLVDVFILGIAALQSG